MSKKKSKKGKWLQIEKFAVCPNCKKPYFRKSALKIKGAGRGYGYCGSCGLNLQKAFKGTPAGKGFKIPKEEKPKMRPTL